VQVECKTWTWGLMHFGRDSFVGGDSLVLVAIV
jgi:hypothetical protein